MQFNPAVIKGRVRGIIIINGIANETCTKYRLRKPYFNSVSFRFPSHMQIGKTALILAAEGGCLEVVTKLIEMGASVDTTDPVSMLGVHIKCSQ